MRECSRKRSTIETTSMFALTPGTPGRSAQMPRTLSRMRTPRSRRGVQRLDDLVVDERVHLGDDLGRLARLGPPPLAIDQLEEPAAQAGRRHHQLLQARRIRIAGQRVEERRRVLGDRLRRRHQPEVGVDARRPLVVVAGAEVHVAPQALRACAGRSGRSSRASCSRGRRRSRARRPPRARAPTGCCAPRRTAPSARRAP